jgi:GT2 family glycosyltransferase
MIEFVSATRLTREEFEDKSALGLSFRRLETDPRWASHVAFENKRGLPDVFNERIHAESENDILAFVHDDIWIDDIFVVDQISQALNEFHVVGVAGNVRRLPQQCAWAFSEMLPKFKFDDGNLRGSVAHGPRPFGTVMRFGDAPAECELLDGVFIATRRSTLLQHKLFFDPRFKFHFYDMDFCRSARAMGLILGTWPIALTHQSEGMFGPPDWQAMYRVYLEKWKE